MVPKRIAITWRRGEPLHALWRNFFAHPPEGYVYVDVDGRPFSYAKPETGARARTLHFLWDVKRRNAFMTYHYKVREETVYSRKIERLGADLVYCINGRIHRGPTPWVVDFENPSAFFGFNRRAMAAYRDRVAEDLMAAKAVLPYSETGKQAFFAIFKGKRAPKIRVVRNCTPDSGVKSMAHDTFTLLTTGSTNVGDNFFWRGGAETIRAFLLLNDRHPDTRLVIRSSVPDEYRRMLEGRNVELHEGDLPFPRFQELFLKSDVYVLPAYAGFALSNIEAMMYGLPVVTSDFLENGEPVVQDRNGFKIRPPKIPMIAEGLPAFYLEGNFEHRIDETYIAEIAEAIEKLYKDAKLCRRLGMNARRYARQKYSIRAKNDVLKRIYDEATK